MENILNDIDKSIIKNNLSINKSYKAIMNEFFERVFKNIVRECYNNDYDKFLDKLNNITLKYSVPTISSEVKNLFIIKKMIIDIYNYELRNEPFFCYVHDIEDYIDVKITWLSVIDESDKEPSIYIEINKELFTQDYNNWCGSPIVIDEFGKIQLFESYEDKNISRNKEYYNMLDSARFGSYLKNFANTFENIRFLSKVVEDKLNAYRCC